VQGSSYLDLLEGRDDPIREAIFYEIIMEKNGPENFPIPERGVRTRDWLYVRDPNKPLALYNLRTDPLEMDNLVGSSQHQPIIRELDQLLSKHMNQTGDDWQIEAIFPPPNYHTYEEGDKNITELLKTAIQTD
jgi:arylsulfatase A-like enzyme